VLATNFVGLAEPRAGRAVTHLCNVVGDETYESLAARVKQ